MGICMRECVSLCNVGVMGGWAGCIREHSRKYKRALCWEDV